MTPEMVLAGVTWLSDHYRWSDRLLADASEDDVAGLLAAVFRGVDVVR